MIEWLVVCFAKPCVFLSQLWEGRGNIVGNSVGTSSSVIQFVAAMALVTQLSLLHEKVDHVLHVYMMILQMNVLGTVSTLNVPSLGQSRLSWFASDRLRHSCSLPTANDLEARRELGRQGRWCKPWLWHGHPILFYVRNLSLSLPILGRWVAGSCNLSLFSPAVKPPLDSQFVVLNRIDCYW